MKKRVLQSGLLMSLLLLAACHSGNVIKPAGEKSILQNMGHGLMGQSFASLNQNDRRKALAAEYSALETAEGGKAVNWTAANGSGTVTPGQPYQVGSQNCRQYSHSFTINGIPQTARGAACRNPDGSWTPLT